MSSDLLTVKDLVVSFVVDGDMARVLDGVTFSIGSGEIVGLVGESGCGKSTLARAILGILPENVARIEGGSVEFDGMNLLSKSRSELSRTVRGRAVTFIPQDPFTSFNPAFTIGAQIMDLMKWKSPAGNDSALRAPLGRFWRGYPRARRLQDRTRVLEMLRAVQLPDPEAILSKYPHEVSGGQRQRLMIAMALLPEPRLIIADEPTTALDVTIQAQILTLLRNLARDRGVAVLFTTHDLGTTYEICDRITVMYAGQEMESAPIAEFFNQPSHPYTEALLNSLPNAVNGIRGIPGEIPSMVAPPGGCRFHPRCPAARERCTTDRPERSEVGPRHMVRCFHPVRHERLGSAA